MKNRARACDSHEKRDSRHVPMSRDVVLRTPRLVLRSFRGADIEDSLAYRNDRELARFLRHILQPFTRADAEVFLEKLGLTLQREDGEVLYGMRYERY